MLKKIKGPISEGHYLLVMKDFTILKNILKPWTFLRFIIDYLPVCLAIVTLLGQCQDKLYLLLDQ